MTKGRAKELAYEAYPENKRGVLYDLARNSIVLGYELAKKDVLDRVIEWLQGHNNEYIFRDNYMGKEELKISSQMFEDLKNAMEENIPINPFGKMNKLD